MGKTDKELELMTKPLLSGLTLEKWRLIQQAATVLKVPDLHLAAVIAFETGEGFSPLAENPYSGAIGLIQFTEMGVSSIPDFAKGWGWFRTKNHLKKMTFEQQLIGPTVSYLIANKATGKQELADLYMSVLAPVAVNKPMDFVLYRSPNKSYNQNKGLDDAKKGYITKADAAQEVYKKLEKVTARVKQLEAQCQS
jgi:hypothetical protein